MHGPCRQRSHDTGHAPPYCALGACLMLYIDLGPQMQCLGLKMDLRGPNRRGLGFKSGASRMGSGAFRC